MVSLAFAINYYFGGENPWGYRLAHLVTHVLSSIFLWAIVARTLATRSVLADRFSNQTASALGFVSALLWMVHPVHTETLIYLTQRTELMMGFFYLLVVLLSLYYWDAKSKFHPRDLAGAGSVVIDRWHPV